MNFKDLSQEQRHEIATRGGEALRSPELKYAWANQEKLRKEANDLGMSKTARKYNISLRSAYRIIRGK